MSAHWTERVEHCHGIVTRDGIEDACGKPAVAVIDGRDVDEDHWPACAYHAHRYGRGRCVPLVTLIRQAQAQAWDEGWALRSDYVSRGPSVIPPNPYGASGVGVIPPGGDA